LLHSPPRLRSLNQGDVLARRESGEGGEARGGVALQKRKRSRNQRGWDAHGTAPQFTCPTYRCSDISTRCLWSHHCQLCGGHGKWISHHQEPLELSSTSLMDGRISCQ